MLLVRHTTPAGFPGNPLTSVGVADTIWGEGMRRVRSGFQWLFQVEHTQQLGHTVITVEIASVSRRRPSELTGDRRVPQ